jgi:hypothetical protein
MAEITRDDLRTWFKVQRGLAADRVREYAVHESPLVAATEIDTLCEALGDISVNEAFEVLDQRQRELAGRDLPRG